ncbi:MAG TPA: DUF5131 family protein [Planctomycetota bacterium]|nr:DUF5131 family protein [Planctomycetota bacterium]
MGENSSIEWTDHTFNPWIGCTKVSPGCANCYAEVQDRRFGYTSGGWGKGKPRKRTSPANWKKPVQWNKAAAAAGRRAKVFCASLADVFDEEVPALWRESLFDMIRECQALDWLLLTKRPGLMKRWFGGNRAPDNVWLGVSVEDQKTADERIPQLLEISARIHWISYEPALEGVDFRRWLRCEGDTDGDGNCPRYGHRQACPKKLDWIIVGGESGRLDARPFNVAWARSTIAQCDDADVAVFVKQLGTRPIGVSAADLEMAAVSTRWPHWPTDLKGGNVDEWPGDLRVREYPKNH